MNYHTWLVTGSAGFIGSNFVLQTRSQFDESVVTLDKLTYAGHLENLTSLHNDPKHVFVEGDIADSALVASLLQTHKPSAVINFAAESHVDRSIHAPSAFVQTNVVGVFHLLDSVRHYWQSLAQDERDHFRFLHVSTDEVYGSLGMFEDAFKEENPYRPNSPYAASKASSDHFVRAYHHTYNLPTLTTNCSNNYGPFHYPEKLIPLVIMNALQEKPLPVYGDGKNIRDWLYVEDHCRAIRVVLESGEVGSSYNIGGWNERTNLEVVEAICETLDELRPRQSGVYRDLIQFVADRPGHDRRYAIDASKIDHELGWKPRETFETGLRKTVEWYLNNMSWVNDVTRGVYQDWLDIHYGANV